MKDINEKMNPVYSTIRRVENGWVLSHGNDIMCRPSSEFVFHTSKQLSDFIAKNFKIPTAPTP